MSTNIQLSALPSDFCQMKSLVCLQQCVFYLLIATVEGGIAMIDCNGEHSTTGVHGSSDVIGEPTGPAAPPATPATPPSEAHGRIQFSPPTSDRASGTETAPSPTKSAKATPEQPAPVAQERMKTTHRDPDVGRDR